MSKVILSGDLGRFRPELLIRLLESIKADVTVTFEAQATGHITLLQGKVNGAVLPPYKGLDALRELVGFGGGTFTVREIAGQNTASLVRSPDLMNAPDNATLFRAIAAQRAQRAGAPVPAGAPAGAPRPPASPSGTLPPRPPGPPGAPPGARPMAPAPAAPPSGPKVGPLAKIPHLSDKGKATAKSLQQNFARGMAIDHDRWRVLMRVDSKATLYAIGEEIQIMGDRLMRATKELVDEGMIVFDSIDTAATKQSGSFKFGEYMVAKGYITKVQLEAALQRQQELARRGRYLWLGEILVEMNFVRAGQVQEAVAYQKRSKK